MIVPVIVPQPPARLAPPITTAAIMSSSRPIPASTIGPEAFFIILTPRIFILTAPVSLARLVREAAALRNTVRHPVEESIELL